MEIPVVFIAIAIAALILLMLLIVFVAKYKTAKPWRIRLASFSTFESDQSIIE